MAIAEDTRELAAALRAARRAAGRSLNAAARPAKISAAYLQKLEAGLVKNPSPRVLQRLAGVLDVPYGRLMALAGYLMPAPEAAGGSPSRAGSEAGWPGEELTEEERRAVAAFISFLKAERKRKR